VARLKVKKNIGFGRELLLEINCVDKVGSWVIEVEESKSAMRSQKF
jgi:hypothetical protein